jgi:hypothetical protein
MRGDAGTLPARDDFAHQIGGMIDCARTTIADRRLGHHRLARNMIIAEPRIASRAARLGVALFRSWEGCDPEIKQRGDKLSKQHRAFKWHNRPVCQKAHYHLNDMTN